MTTNISVMDTGYSHVSTQPVMGIYALYQQPVVEAPVEEDEAKSAEADCQAKVIVSPGKAKAAPAKATAAVETK